MLDIHKVIASLQSKRPLFHSEADFQLALAWEIQSHYPEAEIRLEYNFPKVLGSLYVDIWVKLHDTFIPIELKYKTKKSSFLVNGEQFTLKNHGAHDCGRYDFLKDISRVEQVASLEEQASTGYAIMLTNDSLYWRPSKNNTSIDTAFKIHEGRELFGNLAWGELASAGTKRNRESEISVLNSYNLNWRDFSVVADTPNAEFKMLIVQVNKSFPQISS